MTQSESLPPNSNDKILSADELRSLLRNPPQELIKESYGKFSILIDGYTFEDEHLILDDSITVNLPLTFQSCTFKSDKLFFIDGLTCNESLTFEGCTISDAIYFSSGTFKKEVLLKYVHAKKVHLSRCTIDKISISGYNINEVWVSGTKFKNLHIGEHLIGDNISQLTILAKEDETGDIFVQEQGFDRIFLSGTNKGKTFNFSKIKCNTISIADFKNEGSLNFYGIEPKDLTNDKRYFQIVKPLKLEVTYENEEVNYIRFIVNFDPDSVFSEWKYKQHQRSMQAYGDGGVSVFLIHELFSVLTEFKVNAAKEGYSVDTEIIGFDNVVRLVNKKKDWIQFYSHNTMNSYGFFQTNFYNQSHLKINNVNYELESNNYRALSEIKVFWASKTTGLDGKSTPSYHFLKFFNLLDE